MKEKHCRLSRNMMASVLMLICLCLQSSLNANMMPTTKFQPDIFNRMDKIEPLISQDEIKNKISQVAQALDRTYQGEELTIVMVMKGALCLTADLIRQLQTPCTVEYVQAASYGQKGAQRGELKLIGLEDLHLVGKNVLLVDDVYDSGETLTRILSKLEEKHPKTLKSLVLLSKNAKRNVTYTPDYVLFSIENQFVIGYGLDYKEGYRGLPGIYIFTQGTR